MSFKPCHHPTTTLSQSDYQKQPIHPLSLDPPTCGPPAPPRSTTPPAGSLYQSPPRPQADWAAAHFPPILKSRSQTALASTMCFFPSVAVADESPSGSESWSFRGTARNRRRRRSQRSACALLATTGPPNELPTARIARRAGDVGERWQWAMDALQLVSIVPGTLGLGCGLCRLASGRGGWEGLIGALWAGSSALSCWGFSAGLVRRWRAYYAVLPSLVRLLALQMLIGCSTRITIGVLGNGLLGWMVCAISAWTSKLIEGYVTSNLVHVGPDRLKQRKLQCRWTDVGPTIFLSLLTVCSLLYRISRLDVKVTEIGL